MRPQPQSRPGNTMLTDWLKPRLSLWVRTRAVQVCALGACFYLWLVSVFNVEARLYNQHDDALYLRQAAYLSLGEWLGDYDELTLAKGPGYPAFIALAFKLNLPLLLAQHLLHIAACVLFCNVTRRLVERTWLCVALFFMLLFNPVMWAMQAVLRDHFYASLTLFVLACAIGLLTACQRNLRELAGWAVGLGLALAVLWNTREEGVWIIPLWLLCAVGACDVVWQTVGAERWKRLALVLSTAVLPLALTLALACINGWIYGAWLTTDLNYGPFAAAYGATMRVKHQHEQRYIPMPAETRERLYRASPAFAELRPKLEIPGQVWKAYCAFNHPLCQQEFFGGFYLWAFRDAVRGLGYYRSASASQEYLNRLANEVNQACANGTLDCLPPRQTVTPVWHMEYLPPFLNAAKRALFLVFKFAPPSAELAKLRSFCEHQPFPKGLLPLLDTLYPCAEPGQMTTITGWAFSPAGEVSLEVLAPNGAQLQPFKLEKMASPELAGEAVRLGISAPGIENARFTLQLSPLPAPDTQLALKTGGQTLAVLDAATGKTRSQTKEIYFHIESINNRRELVSNRQATPVLLFRLQILTLLNGLYRIVFPVLALGALTVLPLLLWRGWRAGKASRQSLSCLTALLALTGLVSRFGLIALVDTTSFEAVTLWYLSPAYVLLICFCWLSLGGLIDQVVLSRSASKI